MDADEGIAKLVFLFALELDWNHNIAIRLPEQGCNSIELHKFPTPHKGKGVRVPLRQPTSVLLPTEELEDCVTAYRTQVL